MRLQVSWLLCAALAACGSVTPSGSDAQPADAALPDSAALDAPALDAGADAGIDALVIDGPAPSPGQELTSGGGRLTSTTFTMDVQLGHAVGQHGLDSTTYRLQANTPIKP